MFIVPIKLLSPVDEIYDRSQICRKLFFVISIIFSSCSSSSSPDEAGGIAGVGVVWVWMFDLILGD